MFGYNKHVKGHVINKHVKGHVMKESSLTTRLFYISNLNCICQDSIDRNQKTSGGVLQFLAAFEDLCWLAE